MSNGLRIPPDPSRSENTPVDPDASTNERRGKKWARRLEALLPAAALLLLVWLAWRIVLPFLPAVCWAFALAVIGQPIYARMLRAGVPRGLAALGIIFLTLAIVIGPGAMLVNALLREAAEVLKDLRGELTSPGPGFAARAIDWLGARLDLPDEASRLAGTVAGMASGTVSSVVTGSMWAFSQVATTLFVLFYFLRDGEAILKKLRPTIPLSDDEVDSLSTRISQTLRVSLGGKIVVGSLQGALGGVIFAWLGLPAPIFWGFVMAVLSIFPVIGAFVVWAPVATALAMQGNWRQALLLAAWGVLVIHPVDNLLGPVLVGSALRMHTLLMFFCVVGGLAAFGAAGVVIGPVTVAVVTELIESRDRRSVLTQPSACGR